MSETSAPSSGNSYERESWGLSTNVGRANAGRIEFRGHDLVDDLMGSASFTEMLLLSVTGRRPTPNHIRVLDAVLVSLVDHGLQPSAVAARMTYASAPEALQGAVAAGLLGAGSVLLGSMERAGQVLTHIRDEAAGGRPLKDVVDETVEGLISGGEKVPGLGHRLHRDGDPRAARLLEVATREGVGGAETATLDLVRDRSIRLTGKDLPLNATGAAAAVLLGLGIPWQLQRGIAMTSRLAGLLGHLGEEMENPMTPALREAFRSASWLDDPAGSH